MRFDYDLLYWKGMHLIQLPFSIQAGEYAMLLKGNEVSNSNRSRLHSSLNFALITFVLYMSSTLAQAQCAEDEMLAEQQK